MRGACLSASPQWLQVPVAEVPIVEPEILIDGSHGIETTARIQERVLTTVYAKLQDNGVLLEGSLLKPSMTVPGIDCADKSDPKTIAEMTVRTLDRSLPRARNPTS